MQLTKSFNINSNHIHFLECERLCYLSKNLYNQGLYRVRQQYIQDKTYKNYHTLQKELQNENQIDYRNLPTAVSQQTLMILEQNYKSYFETLKSYKKNPTKFKGFPKPPKYLDKNGKFVCSFVYGTGISKSRFEKYKIISLTKSSIEFDTELSNIQQVRIVPVNKQNYKIEFIYTVEEPKLIENSNYSGIDIGLNNLATIVFTNKNQPLIINGRPLKSINQYFNKKKAKIQSELELKHKTKKSKRLSKLFFKRNNKIKDYLHKSSRIVVDKLKQANISKLVIGKNDHWKTNSRMGDKTNQNFVSIPHAKFIQYVEYKCKLEGIQVIKREESYTSKCSFLDLEPIRKKDDKSYVGKRISRGIFRSSDRTLINADVNGSYNILRKEFPNAFADGIEDCLLNPRKINV